MVHKTLTRYCTGNKNWRWQTVLINTKLCNVKTLIKMEVCKTYIYLANQEKKNITRYCNLLSGLISKENKNIQKIKQIHYRIPSLCTAKRRSRQFVLLFGDQIAHLITARWIRYRRRPRLYRRDKQKLTAPSRSLLRLWQIEKKKNNELYSLKYTFSKSKRDENTTKKSSDSTLKIKSAKNNSHTHTWTVDASFWNSLSLSDKDPSASKKRNIFLPTISRHFTSIQYFKLSEIIYSTFLVSQCWNREIQYHLPSQSSLRLEFIFGQRISIANWSPFFVALFTKLCEMPSFAGCVYRFPWMFCVVIRSKCAEPPHASQAARNLCERKEFFLE